MNIRFVKFKRTIGFSLVEVLVALVVLTIGLLGMAGLQGYSISGSYNAHLRTQATALAQDIIDRMRANRVQTIINNAYNTSFGAAPPAGAGDSCIGLANTCTPAELAEFDLREWKCNLGRYEQNTACDLIVSQSNLPQGDGAITTVPDPITGQTQITVTVQWSEADGAAGATRQVILTTNL